MLLFDCNALPSKLNYLFIIQYLSKFIFSATISWMQKMSETLVGNSFTYIRLFESMVNYKFLCGNGFTETNILIENRILIKWDYMKVLPTVFPL